MTRRPWAWQSWLTAVVLSIGGGRELAGQQVTRPANPPARASNLPGPEVTVLNAIRTNPVTAPYAIRTSWRKGAVELSGRVGTKQVHDVAVRLAIDCGFPFRDNLVIDTGAAHAVAGPGAGTAGTPVASALAQGYSSSPYVYPPPLFGRLDDPFFGYVPPLVSFPPWWQRRVEGATMIKPRSVPTDTGPGTGGGAASPNKAPSNGGWKPFELDPVKGQVEVTVDAAGQVFLRGVVISEEVRREIEDQVRSVPGVTRVESQFQVQPRPVEGDVPPSPQPPPGPAPAAPGRAPAAATKPVAQDGDPLSRRVVGAIEQKPEVAELPVKVRSIDGVVTLAGQVPTAYEAMMVYRTAQKTPGVRDIVDRLQFVVPDEDHVNPLLRNGRPEDVEPYLASQVRRHVADLATLDRIRLQGDVIELRGTLLHPEDQNRVLAILRSIPVLQGYTLEPVFTAH